MDDVSQKINAFLAVTNEAATILGHAPADVRDALTDVYGFEDQTPLLDLGLTVDRVVNDLRAYDFSHPVVLAVIEFEESIIPDGVPVRLVEAVIKNRNEIWEVHKYDKDPFPSNPHAHNAQNGLKMHLGTGELFRKRQCVGKVRAKDLLAIRRRLAGFALPQLAA